MGSPDPVQRIVRGSHRERRAATRAKVLEAGIQCLYAHGYHATTTTLVAETAGVSRGALLHQFPTRIDLINAIGDYLMLRFDNMSAAMLGTMATPIEQFKGLTDVLWEKNKRPDTIALLEILLAARTDPLLAESLQPRFNKTLVKQLAHTRKMANNAGISDGKVVDTLAVLTTASMWGLAVMELNYIPRDHLDSAFDLIKANRDRVIEDLLTR